MVKSIMWSGVFSSTWGSAGPDETRKTADVCWGKKNINARLVYLHGLGILS